MLTAPTRRVDPLIAIAIAIAVTGATHSQIVLLLNWPHHYLDACRLLTGAEVE